MDEPKGDLEGRTVVVTGANAGIGRATAEALARRGARVVLCGRSAERTMPVIEALRAESPAHDLDFVPLDLASLASVKRCADRLLAEGDRRFDKLSECEGDRLEAHAGLRLPLRTPEMRAQHHSHAAFSEPLNGRRRRAQPAVVSHQAFRHRHVEIRAHERAPARQLRLVQAPRHGARLRLRR